MIDLGKPQGVPTDQELRDLLNLLASMDEHKRYNKMLYFVPYPKQRAFFKATLTHREVGFFAGNRVGKSEAGAELAACHLTGDYPNDWEGKRFDHPTKGWVAGTTSLDVRNVAQTKLCGQYGMVKAFGTGFIPRDRFADKPTLARGVTDAYDTIQVVHKTNGVEDGTSLASFKSFEQGREKFQGDDLDWGWCDEEPDMDVYSEFLTRINGPGSMWNTLTPLKGETDLYCRFVKESSPDRTFVQMSLDEAEHFTEEEKRKKLAGYLAYERDARRYGTALLGSGRVFPFSEDLIKEPLITEFPAHWVFIWGIDFGLSEGHQFGATLIAWDRDNDAIHVIHSMKMANLQPIHHAQAIKSIASQVPVAWPQDGTQRVAGETAATHHLSSLYKGFGLRMLPMHATWPEGGYSTEAGVQEISQRITTNRFKVASHLTSWFEEYRFYHRDKGLIVKVRDDQMSSTRIAIMMKRHARAVALGNYEHRKRPASSEKPDFPGGCIGVDFDLS
jgi:phage terminase large subunit-like protein